MGFPNCDIRDGVMSAHLAVELVFMCLVLEYIVLNHCDPHRRHSYSALIPPTIPAAMHSIGPLALMCAGKYFSGIQAGRSLFCHLFPNRRTPPREVLAETSS